MIIQPDPLAIEFRKMSQQEQNDFIKKIKTRKGCRMDGKAEEQKFKMDAQWKENGIVVKIRGESMEVEVSALVVDGNEQIDVFIIKDGQKNVFHIMDGDESRDIRHTAFD